MKEKLVQMRSWKFINFVRWIIICKYIVIIDAGKYCNFGVWWTIKTTVKFPVYRDKIKVEFIWKFETLNTWLIKQNFCFNTSTFFLPIIFPCFM